MEIKTSDSIFSVHFETLGCRLNQIESEAAAKSFIDAGFNVDMESVTASAEEMPAVLCVVNTCTVTGKAEQKARRLIRLLLRKYPEACVLVTGCYAQLEAEQISKIDNRICVLPGARKDVLADIPQKLLDYLNNAQKNVSVSDFIRSIIPEDSSVKVKKFTPVDAFRLSTDSFLIHSRSAVKIQDGCNNACAYCRIHLARGRSVSLSAHSVLERVIKLEQQGHHEVVLTGVNLSQYHGEYFDKTVDLAELLEVLISSTKHIKFRISSLYPDRVDEALCRLFKSDRVQPHFHLSVQSGSDNILAKMGRVYRSDCVLNAVEQLRKIKDNPFIACDLIAGFPGETDEDFEQTMELCRKANFSWVHAFPFSPRPGTPAFSMKPAVPQSVAQQRVATLTEFAIQSKCSYISLWSGKTVNVITELSRSDRSSQKSDGEAITHGVIVTHGVTDNFLHVEIPGKYPAGSLLQVKIVEPLESRIRRGDECEASAQVVHNENPAEGTST